MAGRAEGRFWGAETDSDEELSASDEDSDVEEVAKTTSRWEQSDSEDSDDSEGRVVKSKKSKFDEELEGLISKMSNHLKIQDWANVMDDFNKLNKLVLKQKRNTFESTTVAPLFVRSIADLETLVSRVTKADQKKMSKSGAKMFTRCKKAVRKALVDYKDEIADYREHPEKYVAKKKAPEPESEEEADSDASEDDLSDSGDDSDAKDSDSSAESGDGFDSEASFDSEYVESDADSTDDDEEEDGDAQGKWKWFIPIGQGTAAKKKKGDEKEKKEKKKGDKKEKKKGPEAAKPVVGDLNKIRVFESVNALMEALEAVLMERGKRGTDKYKQLEKLEALHSASAKFGDVVQIQVHMAVLSAYMDFCSGARKSIKAHLWRKGVEATLDFLRHLGRCPTFRLDIGNDEENAVVEGEEAKEDVVDEDGLQSVKVSGELSFFVETYGNELTKALQCIDSNQLAYVHRLADEALLLRLATDSQAYYERTGNVNNASRMALISVEVLYVRHAVSAELVHQGSEKKRHFRGCAHPAGGRTLGDAPHMSGGLSKEQLVRPRPRLTSWTPTIADFFKVVR